MNYPAAELRGILLIKSLTIQGLKSRKKMYRTAHPLFFITLILLIYCLSCITGIISVTYVQAQTSVEEKKFERLLKDIPSITVEGEVRNKGAFNLLKNYRVKDAIFEAGGLTKDADIQRGEILRINEQGKILQICFNINLAMAEDPDENVILQDNDKVIIHSLWEKGSKHTVFVEGDVKNPGRYPLSENMHVSDLISTAGSIRESANLDETEISSYGIASGKSIKIDNKNINLGRALEKDPLHDLVLKPYDRVSVKRLPKWDKERFSITSGEVNSPGIYTIEEGERLSTLIEKAGGYTNKAYLRGAVFSREKIKKLQQEVLDKMILRLERNLLPGQLLQICTTSSNNKAGINNLELQQKQNLIESLKKLKTTGRMPIKISNLRLLKGSEYDIKLETGDSLYIPEKFNAVYVAGAVKSQSSFLYSDGLDYKDYIGMAGGYTKYADKGNIFILKVNGRAKKADMGILNWNPAQSRWELTAFSEKTNKIEPGDTIVVPEKLEHITWLREVEDITRILTQVAIITGVPIVLF